ncbi:hypothetical protein [Pyrococcus sp. ST04]|uniref:hypothetical protein n=1 Tax=Pyrococcus sp. ST04 TaxID=1183377 RepID=UPI00064E4BBE|nr:hypothetical protein [Pyrococcus sp. ST04]
MFRKLASEPSLNVFGEISEIVGSLRQGDIAGIIVTDQLAYSYVLNLILSSVGTFYYMDVSSRIHSGDILFARVYSLEDVFSALEFVDESSVIAVGSFNVLGINGKQLFEIKKMIDSKGLYGVFIAEEQNLNELDILGEARRIFDVPELFEQLLVVRVSHYRGKYKAGLTVLRTYLDNLASLGEHELSVKEELLFPGKVGQQKE